MPTINYTLKDGTKIPGVTTVIGQNLGWNKGALMGWAYNQGKAGLPMRDTAQKAAEAGTIGHYLIDCEIKGVNPETSTYPKELLDKAETAYLNFLEWSKMVAFKSIATEIHLVSEEYQYGATPDCIAEIQGKLCLLDWKTGNGVYEDHIIQLAAYRQAWEENKPELPLDGGFHLLRIDKETAAFDHHFRHALPEAFKAFLHLLALHGLKKNIK
jgi:hypothetical protein